MHVVIVLKAVVAWTYTVLHFQPILRFLVAGFGYQLVLHEIVSIPHVAPLQERPEDIPTGELPRTLLMVVDRHLVGRVTPGSRLVVTGIYCTHRWVRACTYHMYASGWGPSEP